MGAKIGAVESIVAASRAGFCATENISIAFSKKRGKGEEAIKILGIWGPEICNINKQFTIFPKSNPSLAPG